MLSFAPMDSEQLYEACSRGDSTAQVEAYNFLWEYMYRVAYHMLLSQPGGPDLAQDCAQLALIRIHEQWSNCTDPKAFKGWCRRIVSNLVIDELRRRKRLVFDEGGSAEPPHLPEYERPSLEKTVLKEISETSFRQLLNQSPMSDRSRRVVIGRYFDGIPDESLAEIESERANKGVRPSHIQVTRAKNIAKLKQWELLQSLLVDQS